MRHHVIISGTGRAGTTILVRILTAAGLDTGFDNDLFEVDPISFGGLERDLRDTDCPTIVKSPWIATYIHDILAGHDIVIDKAIICMRDLRQAAESRRRVQAAFGVSTPVNGGLWMVDDPHDQDRVLAELFHKLIFHLSAFDVPLVFLHFPRFATDPDYLITKLAGVFPDASARTLRAAFDAEVRPQLIHDFEDHQGQRGQS